MQLLRACPYLRADRVGFSLRAPALSAQGFPARLVA
jgi:hypothetical protein